MNTQSRWQAVGVMVAIPLVYAAGVVAIEGWLVPRESGSNISLVGTLPSQFRVSQGAIVLLITAVTLVVFAQLVLWNRRQVSTRVVRWLTLTIVVVLTYMAIRFVWAVAEDVLDQRSFDEVGQLRRWSFWIVSLPVLAVPIVAITELLLLAVSARKRSGPAS